MRKSAGFTIRGMAAVLAALTCGCVTGGKRPVAAAVPPAPQPAAPIEKIITPEPPISYPQTVVRLPRPQPIPPDSIPEPPAEEPAARPVPRGRIPAPAPSKDTPAPDVRAPETARPAAQAPDAPVTPALTRTDESALPRHQIEARVQMVKDMLARLRGRKRTGDLDASMARVQSFLSLAQRALDRRDLHQADSMTERAEVIARDLLRAP